METDEFLNYRETLLADSKDDEGFISESSFISTVLPSVHEAKLLDSEDWNESYYLFQKDKIKINGYTVNESGERLQLFIVNEDSVAPGNNDGNLLISLKSYYDEQFSRVIRFIQMCIKGQVVDEIQDSDGVKSLASQLMSPEGLDDYDVIEIFVLSATATVETRGSAPQPKTIDFENEKLKVQYKINREIVKKELIIVKKLIDLNFLHNVLISKGHRLPLPIDFEKLSDSKIEVIKAADEKYFESYLCVLSGNIIVALYRDNSTRMLEKNVRSFLQFPKKGVNSGIRDTIRDEPEKFIAYNNGLTITSTEKEIDEIDGKFYLKTLKDFQIVNGGQTAATIYFSSKDGIPVDKVKVMAKINIAKRASEEELDQLISNISTFSNAQSKVSKVDLRSRNVQLIKLKSLSESIVTPKGLRWFFERAKGELNTMIRMKGNSAKVLKKYPKERRFTKEDLAKYYTAWGETPYLVKKGGEKVFRDFIEEISGEKTGIPKAEMNRAFYENVIARIILFRSLEKLYGEGKRSVGQLRAAAVPYSLSCFYKYTNPPDGSRFFDLLKIWLDEKLEEDLASFFLALLILVNGLIKKYATTDDPSENSKSKELWDIIINSREIHNFMESENVNQILAKYCISAASLKKRNFRISKIPEVNFQFIKDNVSIFSNRITFYQYILNHFPRLSGNDKLKLEEIITNIYKVQDIDSTLIDFETDLISRVISEKPELLDTAEFKIDEHLTEALEFIIDTYNEAIDQQTDIIEKFKNIMTQAESRNIREFKIWEEIGVLISKGKAPSIKDIISASYLFSGEKSDLKINEPIKKVIDIDLVRKMVEWDSKHRILSAGERQYLADFAYGLKNLNAFHEKISAKHLATLTKAGFK